MATPAKKLKTDAGSASASTTTTTTTSTSRKPCPYGAVCYRKNPVHFKECSHPGDKDHVSATTTGTPTPGAAAAAVSSSTPSSGASALLSSAHLPPCKYGAHCYRKNLLHFAEFSHPFTTAGTNSTTDQDCDDDDDDTDVYDSEEDTEKRVPGKSADGSDVLTRGLSLVKSFSRMTEQERRDLILKALAAKEALQKEVEVARKEVQEKDKQLTTLTEELRTGILLLEGEREALEGSDTVYFPLAAERHYKEGSAAQIHFRLAESQFYRLLSGQCASSYRVTKVDYVVTPHLVKRFREAQEKLKKSRGEEWSHPVLGFHGTLETNIQPICETGFRVPGEDGFKHRTDTGFYGAGVYFSEFPAYSMGFIAGNSKLLLCQVLPGKTFQCIGLIQGSKLKAGYDSHTSPDSKELVIFTSHHILPCYVVHYATGTSGDFKYSKARQSKHRRKTPVGPDAPKLSAGTIFSKRMQANNALPTKALAGKTFRFTGPAADSKNLFKLITQHTGKKGSGEKFDVLVAAPGITESNKVVALALEKDLPVVTEDFVYECIFHKKWLDPDYFLHAIYDQ